MRARVLIVDDDSAFRRTVGEALAGRGYDVIGAAETVAEARVALRVLRPDGVVLDINLPDGNGLAFAEELNAACPELRVLVTSSDPSAARGRVGFVPKTELVVTDLTPYLG
jgi:DNA-binding NarL/FixJ family response regulator